ncbi:MAG: TIR domain-containing protein [Ardenticatenaceae bacterium]|nr:TIR domain-containing protein [Ardenticatenaceae bacterium]MCB9446531.1 TIR domain-containing protein [Ardenticatenaceae bacterium]
MSNETATTRQFLQKRFNDPELNTLCADYFPDVYEDFTEGMSKSRKIQLLIDHCQNQRRWIDLQASLKRERPKPYDEALGTSEPSAYQPYVLVQRNQRKIFISHAISHAPRDVEFAHRLKDDLRARGWDTWIAPNDIPPGVKWQEAIDRGLEESGVLVLVLTPKAAISSYVRDETYTAIRLEKTGKMRFLPLLVEDCEMPPSWSAYQHISFQRDYKASLLLLFEQLQPETMVYLAQLYDQLQTAINAEGWGQAQNLGGQIEAQYPDYQDVTDLLARVIEEQKQQEVKVKKLTSLYQQLQKAIEKQEWAVAKTIGQQIQDVDQNYRDVTQLLTQVNESLRQQKRKARQEQARQLQITAINFIRSIPIIAWVTIVGVSLVISLIFMYRGFKLGNQNELHTPIATDSPPATRISAISPNSTQTDVPNTPTSTRLIKPTHTITSTPTHTLIPSPTLAPTMLPTFTPTPMSTLTQTPTPTPTSKPAPTSSSSRTTTNPASSASWLQTPDVYPLNEVEIILNLDNSQLCVYMKGNQSDFLGESNIGAALGYRVVHNGETGDFVTTFYDNDGVYGGMNQCIITEQFTIPGNYEIWGFMCSMQYECDNGVGWESSSPIQFTVSSNN